MTDGITASLQVREEAVEGSHRGLDPVPDMRVVEAGRRGHLEYTQPVDRPSIVAHLGMPVETRPSELRQPHATGVESDVGVVPRLKALLRLVLHNPTNLCLPAFYHICCLLDHATGSTPSCQYALAAAGLQLVVSRMPRFLQF